MEDGDEQRRWSRKMVEEDGRGRWKKGTNEEIGQEMREDVEREGRRENGRRDEQETNGR